MDESEYGDSPLDISFVIPARNEEALLGRALDSIHSAARELGLNYEIIVVNDASTDRTAAIAASAGARVVHVKLHNIGAVRNAGAAVATAPVLYFLDADTYLPTDVLQSARSAIEAGGVGGGARVAFDAPLAAHHKVLVRLFSAYWFSLKQWAAGCNIFCLRSAFETIGGFDTQYFAAEERYLSEALKGQGRFVILDERVFTSARKLKMYSTWRMMRLAMTALVFRPDQLKRREGLEYLYDARRLPPEATEASSADRKSL